MNFADNTNTVPCEVACQHSPLRLSLLVDYSKARANVGGKIERRGCQCPVIDEEDESTFAIDELGRSDHSVREPISFCVRKTSFNSRTRSSKVTPNSRAQRRSLPNFSSPEMSKSEHVRRHSEGSPSHVRRHSEGFPSQTGIGMQTLGMESSTHRRNRRSRRSTTMKKLVDNLCSTDRVNPSSGSSELDVTNHFFRGSRILRYKYVPSTTLNKGAVLEKTRSIRRIQGIRESK